MKRFSSDEPDYAFGQVIQAQRTAIGLTQARLAERLRVSRRAVGDWEGGLSYPKAEHLKQLIELAVKQQAFPAGQETEEIHALWDASHQKTYLDPQWLTALQQQASASLPFLSSLAEEPGRSAWPMQSAPRAQVDWSEALAAPIFYGRQMELAFLNEWVFLEHCRVVSVLGMGGIGKSALVVHAMQALAEHFEVVIFRSLRDAPSCETLLESCLQVLRPEMLANHELVGSPKERMCLVERYGGNTLALNLVAETVADLFGGQIAPFLEANTTIFGGIAELLSEQWNRLSSLEQTVLCWLVTSLAPAQLLEVVDGLRRCSLIELGQRAGSFTLQPVVLEYVTDWLVTTACQEIQHGQLRLLREQSLSQAQAKEYVRQAQERRLLTPLLDLLKNVYRRRAEIEQRMLALLSQLREHADYAQGYGPANVLALLHKVRGDLCGLDLSHLVLRGIYLQGVQMQDTRLSGALIRESVWTSAFDAIIAVAISRSGQYWADGREKSEWGARQVRSSISSGRRIRIW